MFIVIRNIYTTNAFINLRLHQIIALVFLSKFYIFCGPLPWFILSNQYKVWNVTSILI